MKGILIFLWGLIFLGFIFWGLWQWHKLQWQLAMYKCLFNVLGKRFDYFCNTDKSSTWIPSLEKILTVYVYASFSFLAMYLVLCVKLQEGYVLLSSSMVLNFSYLWVKTFTPSTSLKEKPKVFGFWHVDLHVLSSTHCLKNWVSWPLPVRFNSKLPFLHSFFEI